MSLTQDYPPAQLSYTTLTLPSTFTQYCFAPDCPTQPFPYDKYDPTYTAKQKKDYQVGLNRYIQSRQVEYDNNPAIVTPLLNSGPYALKTNYMSYNNPLNHEAIMEYTPFYLSY